MRTAIPTRLQGAAIDRVVVDAINHKNGDPLLNALDNLERVRVVYWRIWLHTADHVNGTFLELHDNGSIVRVTTRDGYDERVEIKPKDE